MFVLEMFHTGAIRCYKLQKEALRWEKTTERAVRWGKGWGETGEGQEGDVCFGW